MSYILKSHILLSTSCLCWFSLPFCCFCSPVLHELIIPVYLRLGFSLALCQWLVTAFLLPAFWILRLWYQIPKLSFCFLTPLSLCLAFGSLLKTITKEGCCKFTRFFNRWLHWLATGYNHNCIDSVKKLFVPAIISKNMMVKSQWSLETATTITGWTASSFFWAVFHSSVSEL